MKYRPPYLLHSHFPRFIPQLFFKLSKYSIHTYMYLKDTERCCAEVDTTSITELMTTEQHPELHDMYSTLWYCNKIKKANIFSYYHLYSAGTGMNGVPVNEPLLVGTLMTLVISVYCKDITLDLHIIKCDAKGDDGLAVTLVKVSNKLAVTNQNLSSHERPRNRVSADPRLHTC